MNYLYEQILPSLKPFIRRRKKTFQLLSCMFSVFFFLNLWKLKEIKQNHNWSRNWPIMTSLSQNNVFFQIRNSPIHVSKIFVCIVFLIFSIIALFVYCRYWCRTTQTGHISIVKHWYFNFRCNKKTTFFSVECAFGNVSQIRTHLCFFFFFGIPWNKVVCVYSIERNLTRTTFITYEYYVTVE